MSVSFLFFCRWIPIIYLWSLKSFPDWNFIFRSKTEHNDESNSILHQQVYYYYIEKRKKKFGRTSITERVQSSEWYLRFIIMIFWAWHIWDSLNKKKRILSSHFVEPQNQEKKNALNTEHADYSEFRKYIFEIEILA